MSSWRWTRERRSRRVSSMAASRQSGGGNVIAAIKVKELRARTGVGMMDCKRALEQAHGDAEKAIAIMRQAGLAGAEQKAERPAQEGVIVLSADSSGCNQVLLEVNCETDFAARNERFRGFVEELAALILAQCPVDREQLLAAPFAGDGGRSVEQVRQELVSVVGENIGIRRFEHCAATDGAQVGSYLHQGRIGVLVQLQGGDATLAHDLAMHIAWAHPRYLDHEQVPVAEKEREQALLRRQAEQSGKPARTVEQIVSGRLAKYLDSITLLGQGFVRDPARPVAQVLQQAGARVERFVRYQVGADTGQE